MRHAESWILAMLLALTLTACAPTASKGIPPILLFCGTGTSPNDVAAIEAILNDHRLEYTLVNSSELDSLSTSQLMSHRLLIVPGGNFIAIGEGLKLGTTANIRRAVQQGLNYMGICAGALLAGDGPHNHLNLTSGVKFDFYADVRRGVHKNVVLISSVGTPDLEHYWEDGPQLTGWGNVVGKYPDGTPAIVQGSAGKGGVILSGVHPEAPAGWRRGMSFTTPASDDHTYAAMLIDAALHGTRLPHF